MATENEILFNELRKIDNQIDTLSYIYAGLNYEYEEMLEKINTVSTVDISKLPEIMQTYRKGLKLSKKDFEKIYNYCKNYDYSFNIYLSSVTFEEIENEIKILKEKREKAELEFRKKLKKDID